VSGSKVTHDGPFADAHAGPPVKLSDDLPIASDGEPAQQQGATVDAFADLFHRHC
jgi:hypothetical protein